MAYTASERTAALDAAFCDLVRVETRIYNAVAERLKSQGGMGSGSFELLRYVRDHPDVRVADLASAFAIGVGSTSKIVDRMEQQRLVARRPNPANRRSSLLSLTPLGEETVRAAEPIWSAAVEEVLGGAVSPRDLTVLARVLGALRTDLERRNVGLPTG